MTAEALVGGTALAQGGGAIKLEPITVTGERVERAAQETTSSVTVFSEDDVRRSGVDGVYEVIERAPNVTPAPGEFLPPIRNVCRMKALMCCHPAPSARP